MKLFPKLQEIKDEIALSWARGRPFLLQGGQRGGKTTMATSLVAEVVLCEAPSPRVYFVAPTVKFGKAVVGGFLEDRGIKVLYKTPDQLLISIEAARRNRKPHPIQDGDVVILDEAFWLGERAQRLFWLASRQTARVLAIGSAGTQPWSCDSLIHKYATWELNPSISRQDLTDEFARDPVRAERDYGIPDVRKSKVFEL
jgi:hypothetical protein